MLRVTGIKGKNVLGIKEIGIEPGKVTVISGENASGKTSALELTKNVFHKASLASLKRVDSEDDPEVVIVLDGDEGQFILEKKGGKTVSVKERVVGEDGVPTMAYKKVGQPAGFVRRLIDTEMVNPIDFLHAPDDKRVSLLLAALPLELDRDALWAAMGIEQNKEAYPIPTGMHPLAELGLTRKLVFNVRTGVNTNMSSKRKSVEQIKRALPAEIPTDLPSRILALDDEITTELSVVESKLSALDADFAMAIKTEDNLLRSKKIEIKNMHDRWAEKRRADLEREISEAQVEATRRCEAFTDSFDKEKIRIMVEKEGKESKLNAKKELILNKKEKLATLRERQKTVIEHRANLKLANQLADEADSLESESELLTTALEALDKYRRSLAEDIPIEGLEVDDNIIKVDDVPFEQLNTAKQIEIAVRVCCLRAEDKTLPLMFVDGLEALDSKNFELFCAEIKKRNVQAFVGRVQDSEFGWEAK